ncbi:4'-phosphopantetheinyl transferase family protein [Streptomyces sp. HUAS TT20]|uniref:4'-phosphopantetheinyl transferase family protein n=1 Tax=Streptomyces sp. HUAS TT20 TaxID=3447509 RepID=UPI0021DA3CC1|nr:4'-phosphopantetheinyl transferase superfamily protein [Streptomyces sp. HUAS 15-9]UXY33096.1 4'-phosphopantetheinyl transferase superfamily protein [Streptomyces sp. HUAS 15-9]
MVNGPEDRAGQGHQAVSGPVDVTAPLPSPLHLAGPEGPWEPVSDAVDSTGVAVVHTTWGEWLTVTLLDPRLRALLGHDWPRYRQTRASAGRLRFAVSRLVMKYTAGAVLQVPPDALDLAYKPGGRPHLRGLGEELELSLAHTDELIVVGVSGTGPIGVDAEPADRQAPFELLGEYVCTPEEAAALAALPEAERTLRLLQLWTLKEAYTKALGQGMRRRFAAFGFRRDGEGRITLAEDSEGARAWVFAAHLVQGRYLVSVAHRPARAARQVPSYDAAEFAEAGPPAAGVPGFPGRWRPGDR